MDGADDSSSDSQYDEAQPARYFGKYPATVIANQATEAGKHDGGITVKVPGILEEDAKGESRALEVLAVPSFPPGFFFVPEKDDPVWVEFVAGDINFPIWTGVWYPKNKGAPKTFDDQVPTEKQKLIRTASGHVVQLDDTADGDAQKIVIHDHKGGNTLTLHKDEAKLESRGASIKLGKDVCTVECGSGKITLGSDHLTLQYGDSNSIKLSAQGIAISGTTKVEITGTPEVSVNGHAVVLGPLIQWLSTHQHVGNMGAPTPLFPADLALITVPPPTMVSKPGGG